MEKAIQESKRAFENQQDEQELIRIAMEQSKKDAGLQDEGMQDEAAIMKAVMEQSK
jgi:hypothetical protein